MPHKVVPARTYVFTAITLLALTALTYAVALIDLGIWNTAVAVAIAAIKMTIVGLIFMHLLYTRGLPRIVVLAGAFWLALLIAFTVTDVFTRSWMAAPIPWSSSIGR